MMRIFRARLRITEKSTRRTWIGLWPWENGVALCVETGTRRLITDRAGYSEYNERGEPVVDSWTEAAPSVVRVWIAT